MFKFNIKKSTRTLRDFCERKFLQMNDTFADESYLIRDLIQYTGKSLQF